MIKTKRASGNKKEEYRYQKQYCGPDPDPPDPHVFGLLDPDPDPLVRTMDPDQVPDPDLHQAKIVRKTLIPTAL
jgi:hypothetical protein